MPKVDFYLLENPAISAVMMTACKLCEKAYGQQKTVYIYTKTPKEADILDKLLWTYNDISFLPHGINLPQTPLLITHEETPENIIATHHLNNYDILLNLTLKTPHFFSQFQRIIEIISGDPIDRQAARERYRFYRDNQCELNSHQLQK